MRLLVVDHDPIHRLGMSRALAQSSLAATVVEVGSMADALARLDDGFECLLIDEDLPDGGALALTTEIRRGDSAVPIIFVSGLRDEEATQRAIDAGATDFYPKHDLSPRRFAFRIRFAIRVAKAEADTARSLEQANALARARDEILAIVSHDLRGPLHAIGLATEALRDETGPSTARYLDAIVRASARAEHLISDLLDASAAENGKISLARAPINLVSVVRQAAADHELPARETGGRVRAIVPDDAVVVSADRDRLLQVLSNLIGNALKHARGTEIDVAVERRSDRAIVTVTDHGPGISASELPHVFDRYWTGRTKKAGAGLGLAIVKGIVAAHDGAITVASRPGEGSRFEVALPLA